MNDSAEYIQKEMERLKIQREKDLHNDLVDRLRRDTAEDNWKLADAAFTPEELAETHARDRRLRLYLKLDFATFWLAVLFLNSGPSEYFEPNPNLEALQVVFIGLIFLTFFGFFVLFFLRRSNRQDFTREFLRRLGVRREDGEKDPFRDRDMIGFLHRLGTQNEEGS